MINKTNYAMLLTLSFHGFTLANEAEIEPNISYLLDKVEKINCSKLQGIVRKNCELTTTILNASYKEYCITTKCEDATIEDMLAWLKIKRDLIDSIEVNN